MTRGNGIETDGTAESALHERRRRIVRHCLESLMKTDPQYFYQPTSTIARAIHAAIRRPGTLDEGEREAVEGLEVRDIEMLLAFR